MWEALGIICVVVAVLFAALVAYSLCRIAGKLSREEESELAKKQMKQGCDSDGC